jgi:hypothetical protein
MNERSWLLTTYLAAYFARLPSCPFHARVEGSRLLLTCHESDIRLRGSPECALRWITWCFLPSVLEVMRNIVTLCWRAWSEFEADRQPVVAAARSWSGFVDFVVADSRWLRRMSYRR